MHGRARIRFAIVLCAACALIGSDARSAAPNAPVHRVAIVLSESSSSDRAVAIAHQIDGIRGVGNVGVDTRRHAIVGDVPQNNGAMLGHLWNLTAQGGGEPVRIETADAKYVLQAPSDHAATFRQVQNGESTVFIVIDNLHCKGCARKIAAQLYAIKGVSEVRVDMPTDTLSVLSRSGATLSPWRVIDAVSMAKERPLKITGAHGELTIEWATERAPKNCTQAQNPNRGGTVR